MRPRVASSYNELVASCEETEHAGISSPGIPVEADARLEIVRVGPGNRRQGKALVAARGLENRTIQRYQGIDGVSRQFIAQSERERQVRSGPPLVLREHVDVIPCVRHDLGGPWQQSDDGGVLRDVVDVTLERCVGKAAANVQEDARLGPYPADVGPGLQGMTTGGV